MSSQTSNGVVGITDAQRQYVAKLCKWKGIDLMSVDGLTTEQASALIDELKAKKSVRQTSKADPELRAVIEKAPAKTDRAYHPQKVGMAEKLVYTSAANPRGWSKEEFKAAVKHFLDLCDAVEDELLIGGD